eukprot:symbB.v1.2.031863.t3/scaffold3678.1/size52145/3
MQVQPAMMPGWGGQIPRMAQMSGRAAASAPPGRVMVKVTNPSKPPGRGHHSTSPAGPRMAHADGQMLSLLGSLLGSLLKPCQGPISQAMRTNGVYTSHSAVAAGVAAWVWAGRLGERVLLGGRVFVDGHQNGKFLAPNWREVKSLNNQELDCCWLFSSE